MPADIAFPSAPAPAPAPVPVPAVRALSCPGCGGTVELRAAGYSIHVGCQYCGSVLDVSNPHVQIITRDHQMREGLDIPLGTRGTFRGVEWEVIGYLRRSENGTYPWEEYLLFNPYHGYRWLVNVRGGWSFGTTLTRTPNRAAYDTLYLDGRAFTRFFSGSAQVDGVVGEFYWRVAAGERVKTADWVCPGFMLSREENGAEVSWTLNEWVPAKEIVKAFGATPSGHIWPPLPHQPSEWGRWLKPAGWLAGIALVFLLFVAILFGGTSWSAAGRFVIAEDGHEQNATLGPITFPRGYQRVDIRADVPVLENGWLDLDYSLVNRQTQQVYEAYGAAERYSGRDSDGDWTEGSRGTNVSIASVPAGTYDLIVDYKGNRWATANDANDSRGWMTAYNQPEVIVEVRQGTLFGANFLIALLLIGAPWLVAFALHLQFDRTRRAESDFY